MRHQPSGLCESNRSLAVHGAEIARGEPAFAPGIDVKTTKPLPLRVVHEPLPNELAWCITKWYIFGLSNSLDSQ
jgi:hypothetical protein